MARGVPAGAASPYHTVASNPGSVSATVGTLGSALARFALEILSAFNFPALTWGIAPGVDRIVMLLCEEPNIREVVLFPMNQRAEDLMMGAPAEATPKQLRELHIRLNLPEKKG